MQCPLRKGAGRKSISHLNSRKACLLSRRLASGPCALHVWIEALCLWPGEAICWKRRLAHCGAMTRRLDKARVRRTQTRQDRTGLLTDLVYIYNLYSTFNCLAQYQAQNQTTFRSIIVNFNGNNKAINGVFLFHFQNNNVFNMPFLYVTLAS